MREEKARSEGGRLRERGEPLMKGETHSALGSHGVFERGRERGR